MCLLNQPSIIFAGRVVQGAVRPGMAVQLELQPGLFCSCQIRSVEFIDRVSVGESVVALVCAEADKSEAELYSGLCPPGTIVQIKAPT